MWSAILEKNPTPPFSRKACANIWQKLNGAEYRRDDDELKSARALLREFTTSLDERYRVEEVDLPPLDGFTGIAFVLTHFLKKFRDIVRELALDSTCAFHWFYQFTAI